MAVVVLDAEQLRTLAKVIYHREVEAVRNIPFKSEPERAAYLRDCRENYEAGLALLKSGDQLKHEFKGDSVKAPIAHEIFSYLKKGVNSALQNLRNYKVRTSCLAKIKDHADDMMKCLRTLNGADAAAAERLAESATAFKNFMLEYHRTMQSPLSRNFSRMLRGSGLTFQELVSKYQVKLKFQGSFQSLSDKKKIQVYESIIKASGQESSMGNLISKVLGRAGTVFLLFTAGIMVWDIFSSHNKVETALSNIIQTGAAVGGAMLGQALGVAVALQLTGSVLCSVMVGIVTGIAGAIVLGMFASWFVETFITSGGYPVIVTTDLHYYVAQAPDCVALAREIAYRSH